MKGKRKFFMAAAGILFLLLLPAAGRPAADVHAVYLSDLEMKAWTVYKGSSEQDHPERCPGIDMTYRLGTEICIAGVSYKKGLSVHPGQGSAYAELHYDISSGTYAYFSAIAGKDLAAAKDVGEDKLYGTYVSFEVLIDGVSVAESGKLDYMETCTFVVPISGGSTLTLRTTDGEDGIYCDTASWGNAMLTAEKPEFTAQPPKTETPSPEPTERPAVTQRPEITEKSYAYISDMEWTDCMAYLGTSRTAYINRDENLYGEILSINWEDFDKGLCMHANQTADTSFLEIDIEGYGYQTFAAYAGIADSGTSDVSMGSVKFLLIADGEKIYRSETITYGMDPVLIEADISGRKILRLAVENVDGISGDWAAWGNAVLGRYASAEEIFAAIRADRGTPKPVKTAEPTDPQQPSVTDRPVSTPSKTVSAAKASSGGQKGGQLWIVICAVILLAGGAGLAVILFRRRKNKEKSV